MMLNYLIKLNCYTVEIKMKEMQLKLPWRNPLLKAEEVLAEYQIESLQKKKQIPKRISV